MSTTPRMPSNRSHTARRWSMPAFCVLLGTIVAAAALIGGQPGFAAFAFAEMALIGAAFAFLRRNETLQGIGGPDRDERWELIDLRATAYTGGVLILLLLGLWVADLAGGDGGSPYTLPLAVAGAAYVLFVAVLRRRS
jgi:hypothetical protein